MSAAILTSILKLAVGAVWNSIKKKTFKPDTTLIDTIMGGFDKLEHLVKELDYENKIWGPMQKIYYWVQRTKEVVDDLIREDNAAHREAYDAVISALKTESDGIRFQTYSIYSTLVSLKTPLSPDGLLKFWADTAYKKLADERDTGYHMDDYVRELDTNIAAAAALLHHGLVLSMLIATSEKDAEKFRDEATKRIEDFRRILYQQLYPPALSRIKTSYDDPGAQLTDGRWFNLYDESDSSNSNFIAISDSWIREIHRARLSYQAKAPRAFRFVAADSQRPLGPLEMHAHWDFRGNTRVLFYDHRPYGAQGYTYTNTEGGYTVKIHFKLIPVQVDDRASGRTPVKLIPYREAGGARTVDDYFNTWATTWRLQKTDSPQ